MYNSLRLIKDTSNSDSIEVFTKAINNLRPQVEVKSRRAGGAVMQVPLEVDVDRGTVLALQWLLTAARSRAGSNITVKLTQEILDASQETGAAMKKRAEVYRMAEANKAFAKFRF